ASLCVFDPASKKLVGKVGNVFGSPYIESTAERRRVYVASQNGTIECIRITEDMKAPVRYSAPWTGQYQGVGPFVISPDDSYLIASTGQIYRLARSQSDDLKPFANIPPHRACVVDVAGERLYTSTDDGKLNVYTYPDFTLKRSWKVPQRIYCMTLDTESSTLYAAHDDSKQEQNPYNPYNNWGRPVVTNGVGDLAVYDLHQPW